MTALGSPSAARAGTRRRRGPGSRGRHSGSRRSRWRPPTQARRCGFPGTVARSRRPPARSGPQACGHAPRPRPRPGCGALSRARGSRPPRRRTSRPQGSCSGWVASASKRPRSRAVPDHETCARARCLLLDAQPADALAFAPPRPRDGHPLLDAPVPDAEPVAEVTKVGAAHHHGTPAARAARKPMKLLTKSVACTSFTPAGG